MIQVSAVLLILAASGLAAFPSASGLSIHPTLATAEFPTQDRSDLSQDLSDPTQDPSNPAQESADQGPLPDSTVLRLMAEYSVPGLSLALVHGSAESSFGWGFASPDTTIRVTPDTPFRVASVAKTLVAASVLREASARGIDLHSDVEELIGFPLAEGFSEPVTLHHLLTHTGGFDERMVGYAARTQEDMRPLGEYLSHRMPDRGWPAGEIVAYSNHGMSLAAYAVERAAGRPFAEVAEKAVFQPLGMNNTAFLRAGDHIPAAAAPALECTGDGVCEAQQHLFSHTYPAGLLFSTARDMGLFIGAVLEAEDEDDPLSQLLPERYTHDPRIPGMSYGLFNQAYGGRRVLAHSGSAGGYWALLLLVPEEGLGFFFAANGGDSGFGPAFRDELLRRFLGSPSIQAPAPHPTEDPSTRSGAYELTRYSHRTIERLPQLFHNSITLQADGDTLWVFSGGRATPFLQVGDSLYGAVESEELLAFGNRRGIPYLFRSSDVYGAKLPAAYERRPRFGSAYFMNEYVSWLMAGPLLVLALLWPILAIVKSVLRRRRDEPAPHPRIAPIGTTVSTALAAGLFTWFVVGFTARSNRLLESGEMLFGMPEALSRLLWIPYLHVALTTVLVLLLPLAWKRGWWDLPRRLLFGLIAGALVLQALFFFQWNYLPASW